jgi:hypothetical protein
MRRVAALEPRQKFEDFFEQQRANMKRHPESLCFEEDEC